MNRVTIHLELVTPCFLGGTDQARVAEWRAQSIRGQLRWWFRAVAGGAFGGDLAPTKEAEATVFGSTARKSKVQVITTDRPAVWTPADGRTLGSRMSAEALTTGAGYGPHHRLYQETVDRLKLTGSHGEIKSNPLQYLGYGCVGLEGLDRPCLQPGQAVSFRLGWHEAGPLALSDELRPLLAKALWAWLALGGIGSKSRNGFGSLHWSRTEGALPEVEGGPWSPPATRKELEEGVRRLLASVATSRAPEELDWTQLSRGTEIFVGREEAGSWEEALTRAGAWVIAFRRRYGLRDDSRTLRGDRNVAGRDYTWAAPSAREARRDDLPDRAGFGLPLPFGGRGEMAVWSPAGEVGRGNQGDRRRAAPLLIHIAHVKEGYLPVLSHLPARFLPEAGRIHYKDHSEPASVPGAEQIGIIGDFLDDLRSRGVVRRVEP